MSSLSRDSVEIHRQPRDTGSSLYPMSSSLERRLADDDEESESEEEEENEEETESEEAEETESSELIRENGEGHMHEKEPSLKRDKVLAASNGHNVDGHKWPKLGPDCTEGRMVCLLEKSYMNSPVF